MCSQLGDRLVQRGPLSQHLVQMPPADQKHFAQLGHLVVVHIVQVEKLADFLFWLWRRLEMPGELHLPMRLLDIADHLGLRLETVSRQLAALRRAGLVGPLGADGVLPVLNGAALRQR